MNEQRAHDALRHLQAAAVEMIEATRAALEVVEDIVRDPSFVTNVVTVAQAAAQSTAEAATQAAGGRTSRGPAADPSAGGGEEGSAEEGPRAGHEHASAAPHDGRSRVTRIPVT